jgi:O-antigen/teichoic acid export membrane protein
VGKDSALWLAAAGGVITSAVVALLAPLIALVFAEPLVTPLMVVGALKLLPAALACVPQQRLARVLKHREIAAASVLATLASALLRIFLALQGAGAWAFVLAQVAYSLALLLALWALAPMRPRFRFDHAFTRELFTLGMPTSLSNALTQWARNIDYVFVGALLGTVPLGLYRVAFDLAMEPVVAAGDVMARSVAPNLRRLASSYEELSRGFGYAVRVTFAISLPLAIGTFVFAPHLLELTQDASFLAATSATRWLIVAALLRVMLGLYTPLAVALGRPGLALRASSEQFVLLIVSLGACIWLLGDTLDIASAGVAWCIALGVALYINHLRFRDARACPRRRAACGEDLNRLVGAACVFVLKGQTAPVVHGLRSVLTSPVSGS